MHSITILLSALAAIASAQDTSVSSVAYSNPNTQYTTQTNSDGVITGMPAVETSQPNQPGAVTTQPAVITSQPDVATLPALPNGLTTLSFNNHTYTVSVNGNQTSIISSTSTSSSATGAGASGSGSGSGSSSTAKGAAATGKAAAGALIGAAGLVAALL
jgi:hypothetical protein